MQLEKKPSFLAAPPTWLGQKTVVLYRYGQCLRLHPLLHNPMFYQLWCYFQSFNSLALLCLCIENNLLSFVLNISTEFLLK
jgi:hypothetical protein